MKYIALHHSAVNTNPQVWAVNRYHKGKWNMKSSLGWYVGYNYFCEKDGTRYITRKVGEETIAVVGHNCNIPSKCDTISYCMAGDFNTYLPTDAQEDDFKKFIEQMRKIYPKIKVVGHRDLQKNRTCPGRNIISADFKEWNLKEPPEDQEKAEKIAQLSSLLDQLRTLYQKLLSILY